MYKIAIIPFLETSGFMSFFDTKTNMIYISPKSVCDIFNISWQSQYNKLTEDAARWHYQTIMIKLPGDDRQRKMGVIPDSKVRPWVCSINPAKVRPDIREQLIAFQTECDHVLHTYWTNGIAVNPRHNYQMDDNFKVFIAETIGVAISTAMHELGVVLRDSFQDFRNQYEHRLSRLEQDRGVAPLDVPIPSQISVEQAQRLRDLVKEKGGTRKGICRIWKKFRQKFQLESYQHLPSDQFQEALRWVNSL